MSYNLNIDRSGHIRFIV